VEHFFIINSYEEKEECKIDTKPQLCINLAFFRKRDERPMMQISVQGLAGTEKVALCSQ